MSKAWRGVKKRKENVANEKKSRENNGVMSKEMAAKMVKPSAWRKAKIEMANENWRISKGENGINGAEAE
jgi:hypothetical protein